MRSLETVTCKGEDFCLNDWQFAQYERFLEQAEENADSKLVLTDNEKQEWLEEVKWSYLSGLSTDAPNEDTCCFCGAPLEEWHTGAYGNNPDPAATREGARCCDACNRKIVIPARIMIHDLVRSVVGDRS